MSASMIVHTGKAGGQASTHAPYGRGEQKVRAAGWLINPQDQHICTAAPSRSMCLFATRMGKKYGKNPWPLPHLPYRSPNTPQVETPPHVKPACAASTNSPSFWPGARCRALTYARWKMGFGGSSGPPPSLPLAWALVRHEAEKGSIDQQPTTHQQHPNLNLNASFHPYTHPPTYPTKPPPLHVIPHRLRAKRQIRQIIRSN